MLARKVARVLVAVAALAVGAVGVQITTASAAAAPRTLYYDASRAAEFKPNMDEAAAIWNASVSNIKLVAKTPAPITIVAFDGWPYAEPRKLGQGTVHMGRQAVRDGFDKTRIAAHELGHIFGLPDRRTGLCSDLMSGHSAPTSCKNAKPSPKEAAQVQRNFAGGVSVATLTGTFEDCFRESVPA
jgi:snapalysin